MPEPTPDRFGRYRVAEKVGGKTRHYSTRRYLPGVHAIVTGPDAAASYDNGQERPPKFNVAEPTPPNTNTTPKGA